MQASRKQGLALKPQAAASQHLRSAVGIGAKDCVQPAPFPAGLGL